MSNNKIDDIESQIEKLKKKKTALIAKREKEIGAYLLKTWNVEDKTNEEIFQLIKKNNPINNTNNIGEKNE